MRPLFVLNVVLAALTGLAVWSFVDGWSALEQDFAGVSAVESGVEPSPGFAGAQPTRALDIGVIVRGNPFSVDRSAFVPVIDLPVTPTGPRPYLSGTIRIGDDHMAMMAPSDATSRGEYRPFRVGQFIGGWEIVEIDDKSVVVASGGGRQTIMMNDPSAGLPRTRQAAQAVSSNPVPQVSTVGAAPKAPVPPPPANAAATTNSNTLPGTSRTVPYQTPWGTIQKVVP
jgi:hypothetical protein